MDFRLRAVRYFQACLALTALALLLRVGFVLAAWDSTRLPYTYEHGEIAQNLLSGRGFTVRFLGDEGPTSQQSPLYPALLAASMWLFGPTNPHALLALQLLQAVAGAAVVPLVARLGQAWFPKQPQTAGLLGAAIATIYPPHLYMVTHIQVVTWCTLALLAAFVFASQTGKQVWSTLAAGVCCAVLVLLDPILGLAIPGLLWARWQAIRATSCQSEQMHVRLHPHLHLHLAAMVALVAVGVFPWTMRNRLVHGEWVWVKSTFGYAFWQANNPLSLGTDKLMLSEPSAFTDAVRRARGPSANSGWSPITQLRNETQALAAQRLETVYIDDLLLKPQPLAALKGLNEPGKSRLLGQQAVAFIKRHPAQYAGLCCRRLGYFCFWDPTNPKAGHWAYRGTCLFWLGGLFLFGSFCGQVNRRVWPAVITVLFLAVFHALVIYSARFRIPVEGLTLPLVVMGWQLACFKLAALFKLRRGSGLLATSGV